MEHTAEITEIYCQRKKNSSNQLFSNFFSKTIAFTKFLRKKCEREFLQFPHCVAPTANFFRQIDLQIQILFREKVNLTIFFQKIMGE